MNTQTLTSLLAATVLAICLPAQVKERPKPKPADTPKAEHVLVASLGVSTRAPTKAESAKYSLDHEVRYNGQIVTSVQKGSTAAKAGLKKGDVLLQIDKLLLFSHDDILDVLMVRKPGQEVTLRVKRAKAKKKVVKVRFKLGAKKLRIPKDPRLEWHYSGLPYLKEALARAKKEQKRVLVGLSGAET